MVDGVAGVLKNFSAGAAFVLLPLQPADKQQLCRGLGKKRLLFSKNFTVPVWDLQVVGGKQGMKTPVHSSQPVWEN